MHNVSCVSEVYGTGADPWGGGGGGAPGAPPLELEKIVIFHTKYLKIFRASLRNWKEYDFWRKIVFFHTKYPKMFRVSLRSAQFF